MADDGLPSTSRLEAFSDGVLAIAITLLILDVRVPEREVGSLGEALTDQWPAYLGYATSFVTIGIMWVNHHALVARVERVSRTLLFANLGLLLGIATLPFTTALAARWLRDPADGRLAVGLYCASLVAVSGAFAGLWAYLRRHPELLRPDARDVPARALRRSLVGPVAYAAATGVSAVSGPAGFAVCAAIAVWFIRPPRPDRG